jgi:hypothetical protein
MFGLFTVLVQELFGREVEVNVVCLGVKNCHFGMA